MASFHDNLGKPVPEYQTILGFSPIRDGGGSDDNIGFKKIDFHLFEINYEVTC